MSYKSVFCLQKLNPKAVRTLTIQTKTKTLALYNKDFKVIFVDSLHLIFFQFLNEATTLEKLHSFSTKCVYF